MKRLVFTFVASVLTLPAASAREPVPRDVGSPAGPGSVTPFLGASEHGLFLSWLEPVDGGHALRVARWDGARFSKAADVRRSERFFVNWADFPSVLPFAEGRVVSHWLEKSGEGTYEYDVWIALSEDGGESWKDPLKLHRDGVKSEHGFASLVPWGEEGFAAVWLDGRQFREGQDDNEMAVAATLFDGDELGAERILDRRVCECCQTGMAATADGLIAAYRDRSPDEIRDIAFVRFENGTWTEPRTIHDDGWQIHGCPVNGPQIASHGDRLAVAWFTAAGGEPRVRVAFSSDGGRGFSDPVTLPSKSPVGRVDVELVGTKAVVSWVEHVEGGVGDVRIRSVAEDGTVGEAVSVATTGSGRASGFPRMASYDGSLFIAWTDSRDGSSRVRIARLALAPGVESTAESSPAR